MDIPLTDRLRHKTYEVTINGEICPVYVLSITEALVKASQLRLDDGDRISVRLGYQGKEDAPSSEIEHAARLASEHWADGTEKPAPIP